MVYLLALLHALVDAACAAKLYSSTGRLTVLEISSWFLLYNLLAFSTQAIAGGILDAVFHRRLRFSGESCLSVKNSYLKFAGVNPYLISAVSGAFLVALGAAASFPLPVGICLIGLGNSLFHTGGGAFVLSASKGKAAGIGIFVGPGSLGLVLGTLFSAAKWVFIAGLAIFGSAAAIIYFRQAARQKHNAPQASPQAFSQASNDPNEFAAVKEDLPMTAWTRVMIAVFLLLAVVFRAFGGSFPAYSWKKGTAAILFAALFVTAGKIAGGFAYDRFGAWKTILVSSLAAALIIGLFSNNAPASAAGIFALNIAMPVTLVLLYRCLHRYPAFAFGLAASVLFPGSILGQMAGTGLVSEPAWVRSGLFICCSLTALIIVLVSCVFLNRAEKKKEDLS